MDLGEYPFGREHGPMDQDISLTKTMVFAIYFKKMPPLVLPTKVFRHLARSILEFIECVRP